MTSFEENLVAEAIGLIVGLLLTYVIVNRLLKAQERRTWAPARVALLSSLKRSCESAIVSWARNSQPPRLEVKQGGIQLSKEIVKNLVGQLDSDLAELSRVSDSELLPQRGDLYWRAQLHGLAALRDQLNLAVSRAQLTLREYPQLVESIASLESAYANLPGLNEHIRLLESLRHQGGNHAQAASDALSGQMELAAWAVVRVLSRFLDLWRQLTDIPGTVK